MTLTLRAVSLNDLPLTQPITAQFDFRGTIGRADDNTMALPDPVRHISRKQAEIIAGRSGYVIKNVGSANPILVRNQPLGQGESAPLMHSDQVRIGGYLLEVIDESAREGDATTIAHCRALSHVKSDLLALAAVAPMPLGDLGSPLSHSNPFANLLGEAASPAPKLQRESSLSSVGSAPSRLPDDFDPFAVPAATATAPVQSPPRSGSGLFDDLIPSAAPPSIDEIFGLKSGRSHDPLAEFMGSTTPAHGGRDAGGGAPLSTDPLALFGAAKNKSPAPLPAQTSPDHAPELQAAFIPPKPVAVQSQPAVESMPEPEPAAVPAQPDPESQAPAPLDEGAAQAAEAWNGDAASMWAAFCEGAGIKLNPPQGPNPELMRAAGMLLRSAAEGALQLMAVRSATRNELHAQVTVIRPRNNNPLKFSPDAQSALEQMLQPPLRGFMPGPAAMTDAMNDLVGHAIGTMAGTRAALEGVLNRFAPGELEAKLAGKSVLDSVLPMNRKARLWDLYLQHHGAIRDEAQDDFQALFGKAFLAAYEQQLERLRRDDSTPSK
ncbi:MAG: type VI secretion system-associated FHA domain protein TagH [Burkholderiales bacterium]|nr:type VI secretion system-associated FHA domain protein TagH [Burkholderiales bacterium]